ncbi:MAG: hypothetical protein V1834_03255 [Candidatus Micrarchaeota archaeon]
MDFNDFFTKKRILFIGLFAIAAVLLDQINFSAIMGTQNQSFTLFQFFAPITAAFLGPIPGVISVLLAQGANFFLLNKEATLFTLLRFAPMALAAYYFAVKTRLGIVFPALCMALFWIHPIGGQVWFYPLYWLIPIAVELWFKSNLFAKSLGTTFTAHAVGSVLFLYSVPSPPSLWLALIPVVAMERFMFALGITGSFVAVNAVLNKLSARIPQEVVEINPRFTLR